MIYVYGGEDEMNNLIRTVYNATLVAFDINDLFNIDVSFLDLHTIKELNYDSRGINKPTDVLSYPYVKLKFPVDIIDYPNDVDPDTGRIMLGEIMLCLPIIKDQADEYCNTFNRELAYMTVHGLLHLLGFDHKKDDDRTLMRKKEEEILSSIGYGID